MTASSSSRREYGSPHPTTPPNYGSIITRQASTETGPDSTGTSHHGLPPPSRRESISTFVMENRGLFFLALAQLFGGVMNLATRFLATSLPEGRQYHTLQILFVRMAATMVISYSWMWWNTVPDMPFGKREVRGLLIARGCSGFVGVFGLYYSLSYLPLPDATVITFLVPTVLSFVCSIIPSINEPFTTQEKIGGVISLIGVTLIARPTIIFDHLWKGLDNYSEILLSFTTTKSSVVPPYVSPEQRLTAVLVALVGVLGAASAYTTIRAIGKRAHPLISVTYFSTITTVCSFIGITLIPSAGGFLLPRGFVEITLLSIIGVSGFILQFLLTKGLQLEKAGRAGSLVYTQLIWATVFEWSVWGNPVSPLSLFGSLLILGGAGWVNWQKWRGTAAATEGNPGPVVVVDDEEGAKTNAETDEERRLLQTSRESARG
ncbi:hypothetical protein DFH27DRAFT_481588 [Peziza echinospora]|nr:hypothetical protein DFH27DRAFT_481588 [Peziza echinospora]